MKRPKSKVFKHHKDLIKAAVGNIELRANNTKQAAADIAEAERVADERFVRENRLELEIHAGANHGSI